MFFINLDKTEEFKLEQYCYSVNELNINVYMGMYRSLFKHMSFGNH